MCSQSDDTETKVAIFLKILRAPITLASLVIGGVLMFLYLAAISVGGWYERLLQTLQLTFPVWLPALLGIVTFTIIGLIIPAIGLFQLVGWPGVILGPAVSVLLVSRLDHW